MYSLVVVRDLNGETSTIGCEDYEALVLCLTHLDKDAYKLDSVHVLGEVTRDIKQFCKKTTMEHGGNEK